MQLNSLLAGQLSEARLFFSHSLFEEEVRAMRANANVEASRREPENKPVMLLKAADMSD